MHVTSWSMLLLEKFVVIQLVKTFLRFITVVTAFCRDYRVSGSPEAPDCQQ
jgi:hypothetical protein